MPGEHCIAQLHVYICILIRSKSFEQINALASGGVFVVRVLDRIFWVGGLLKYIVTYLLNLFWSIPVL